MSLGLEALAPCFQGIIPANLFTCSRDGTPNVAFLSHVDYVDPTHVALSFQFFNKSRNIAENPQAMVRVIDPDTSQGWSLRLRFERSETSGPIFERMALRIEAIASYSGLKGIFKLLAADIYEVVSVEPIPEELGIEGKTGRGRRSVEQAVFTMTALQDLAVQINAADTLEGLLDSILRGLDDIFGFTHSMILLAHEDKEALVTIATRGYPEGCVGAEARIGEGIIGMVAEARKPIRISGLLREMLYAHAVRRRAQEAGLTPPERRIPLPGLENPASQLGVPLLVRGELVGVLCIESETPYRFHEEDKTSIELLGSYLAIAIQNVLLNEATDAPAAEAVKGGGPSAPSVAPDEDRDKPGAPACRSLQRHEITFYRGDECILIDGEYLIRGLPARILWKLLSLHESTGRREFTNRELRLDKSLNLPGYKDNLETRLLLLRWRLEQKSADIRVVPRARGRFALDVRCDVTLTAKD